MPKTLLGKWAVGFGIALVALIALELIFAITVGGNPAVIEDSPILTILANTLSVASTLVGPLSFLVGIVAVIKHKEWLVLKILAILYAFSVLFFLLGEFLFPH